MNDRDETAGLGASSPQGDGDPTAPSGTPTEVAEAPPASETEAETIGEVSGD